jgi:Fe-S cluster assembly protein SufD
MSDRPYHAVLDAIAADPPAPTGLREAAAAVVKWPLGFDEAWRFTSARKLLATEHTPSTGSVGALSENVHALLDALDHPASRYLGRVAAPGGFRSLNQALFREGVLVFVPADDALTGERITLTGTDELTTPRVLVVVEEGGELELAIDHTLGAGLHVPVVEIHAGAGATVSITHVVRGDDGQAVCHLAVQQATHSTVSVQSFVLGGGLVRVELTSGGASESTLHASGLVVARGRQHIDHHLEIHHDASHRTSTQLFRHVLDDRARAVFTGQVVVARDVVGSDASQTADSLLLAEGASAVARPWLEIHNDEVVASHGATVGRLDDDALFYLSSRGIAEPEARRMLTTAFAIEVVHTVPAAFQQAIEDDVAAWLAS